MYFCLQTSGLYASSIYRNELNPLEYFWHGSLQLLQEPYYDPNPNPNPNLNPAPPPIPNHNRNRNRKEMDTTLL